MRDRNAYFCTIWRQLSTKCICFRKQRTSRLRTSYSCNISINNFHSVRFTRMFYSCWIFSYVAIWHMRMINTNENINVSSHSMRNVRCYRQKGNSINFDMIFLFRPITKRVCVCVSSSQPFCRSHEIEHVCCVFICVEEIDINGDCPCHKLCVSIGESPLIRFTDLFIIVRVRQWLLLIINLSQHVNDW